MTKPAILTEWAFVQGSEALPRLAHAPAARLPSNASLPSHEDWNLIFKSIFI